MIFSSPGCHVATQGRHLHKPSNPESLAKGISNGWGCVDVSVSLRHDNSLEEEAVANLLFTCS